jgi:ribonuclease E
VRIAIVTGKTLDTYEVSATDAALCRGNIYRGVVAKVQPSLDAAFVDFGAERDGLLRADDVVPSAYVKKQDPEIKHPKIDRILERGQTVLVQVVRDGVGHKGALVDTNLSIAGRYLVLMPLDPVRGVSRKVENEAERNTIRERLDRLQLPEGCGVIVRTNAADQPQRSLNRDLNALLRLWQKIRDEAKIGKGPRLLYSDQDLIVQALRDSVDASIEEILVDDAAALAKAEGFMRTFMPRAKSRLIHYTDRLPLFSKYELESQIEHIYLRKVDLPSGGSIVIDGTEALTAIDVNSGRATRGGSQEETAYATNMEAAIVVARQLRMRDIGGLVVVDFIDMRSSKHRRNVEKAMRDAMKDDKAKHTTSRLSENGLLEINRQRLKKALQLRTHRVCPTCGGAGTTASPELVGLNVLRRIETRAVTGRLQGVRVSLHPELADAIQNDRRQEIAALEREFDIHVAIIAATGLHRTDEEFEWIERSTVRAAVPAATAAVTAADLADGIQSKSPRRAHPAPEDDVEDPTPTDKPARKRRRGGRKRKKTKDGESTPPETDAAPDHAVSPETPDEGADSSRSGDSDDHGGDESQKATRKRRRPRRRRKTGDDGHSESATGTKTAETASGETTAANKNNGDGAEPENGHEAEKPPRKKRRSSRRRRKKPAQHEDTGAIDVAADGDADHAETSTAATGTESDDPPKTRRRRPRRPRKPKTDPAPETEPITPENDPFAY